MTGSSIAEGSDPSPKGSVIEGISSSINAINDRNTAGLKKRAANSDSEIPMPKRKAAKSKAKGTLAFSVPISADEPLENTGDSDGEEDEYTDYEDEDEDRDFKDLIKKVRREYKRMTNEDSAEVRTTKAQENVMVTEVVKLAKASIMLLVEKHDPEDVIKLGDLEKIKYFELVCSPGEGASADEHIAIVRKNSYVAFGKFSYVTKNWSSDGIQWEPLVIFTITKTGEWHLCNVIRQGWQHEKYGGVWGAPERDRVKPDMGKSTLKGRNAIPTVLEILKYVLKAKPWKEAEQGQEREYYVTSASSTSTESWTDSRWEGQRSEHGHEPFSTVWDTS
ncbi:hypothetical protein EV356DRAFT_537077 [Viridothelium virens]|uniref:Uncharacterized protein n=1 Tax=Viridothelium virens TaxID=1048519 RepID=A0A6A6GVA6_VIRVR|nr:hypothetical protein EV356DRAFT_537077 [Viridothelium virens]